MRSENCPRDAVPATLVDEKAWTQRNRQVPDDDASLTIEREPWQAMTLLGQPKFADRKHPNEALTNVVGRELTRKISDDLRARAELRDVELVVYCACDEIRIKPRSFRGAIGELIENSIRASRRGYPVILTLRPTSEGDVLCEVQDSGAGMSASTLADLSHRPRGSKTGAGIARAWAVVADHDGLIRFESAPDLGTTVTVWLPLMPNVRTDVNSVSGHLEQPQKTSRRGMSSDRP